MADKSPKDSGMTSAGDGDGVQDLTAVVQNLLGQMQDKFQTMSDQIVGRIDEMGSRIDELEKNLGDLLAQPENSPIPHPLLFVYLIMQYFVILSTHL
eukprot:gene4424-8537_t